MANYHCRRVETMRRELEQLRSQQSTDYPLPASESSLEQDGERRSMGMAAPASSHDFELKCNGAVSLDGTMLSSSLAVDALKLYVVSAFGQGRISWHRNSCGVVT